MPFVKRHWPLAIALLCLMISAKPSDSLHAVSFPVVESQPLIAAAVMDPAPAIANQNTKSISIPIASDDRALMINATVDKGHAATFILDTGATYTSISQELAEELGYDLSKAPHITITTANGQVSIPKITLKELTLHGYKLHNVEATVISLPKNVPFKGLLGLNFIRRQRITIDIDSKNVLLEPTT